MARPLPPDQESSAAPATPPPTRCRALVNLWTSQRSSALPPYQVIDLRIDDRISMKSAPGLVVQDGEGLVGLQVIHYEVVERARKTTLIRQWSSIVARRLPSGVPAVWLDGELEVPDVADQGGEWFFGNTASVEAVVGPYVSFTGHHVLSTGPGHMLYFGDDWPAFTLSASTGQRVPLPAIVGDEAIDELKEALSPLLGESPDEALGAGLEGFALSWGDARGETPGLTLRSSSGTSIAGPSLPFKEVPLGLLPHVITSPSVPAMVGHPRGCASIGLATGMLHIQRHGDARPTRLMLPLSLRHATFLGIAWTGLDDPFSLSQLSPSGQYTRALPGAPPVKFRFR